MSEWRDNWKKEPIRPYKCNPESANWAFDSKGEVVVAQTPIEPPTTRTSKRNEEFGDFY